jgi:hypothetical protein
MGSHAFGPALRSGLGISRSVCKYCGVVEIDLREADPPETAPTRACDSDPTSEPEVGSAALFGAAKRLSLFEIQHAVDAGLYDVSAEAMRSGRDR